MTANTSASAIDIFDPMDAATLLNPFGRYQALQRSHPVAFIPPLGLWLVSDYKTVREVLYREGFSSALAFGEDAVITDDRVRPARRINLKFGSDGGAVVSSADGEEHRWLRRTVARCLTRQQLAETEKTLAAHIGELISALARDRREVDIASDIARPVAAKAIGTLMGMSDDLTRILAGWVEYTARTLDPGDPLSRQQGSMADIRQNVRSFKAITSFYDARRAAGAAGPTGSIFHAPLPGGRTGAGAELVLPVLQLFQAGYETMVPAICRLISDLFIGRRDPVPPQMAAGALSAAIEEGVRVASPVRATVRVATDGRPVGGVDIPAGALLLVLIGAANRDEQVFPAPERFRPGQRPPHLAFGAGAHRCLGRSLAQLELRQVLDALMASARRIEPAGAPRPTANFLKAGCASLPVNIEWRTAP